MGSNPITLSELEKALDDLILQEAPSPLKEGDITIMSLAARAECSPPKARRMLDSWVMAGKVEYLGKRREPRGHKVDAWRLKQKGSE